MNAQPSSWHDRAGALRAAFDEAFARPAGVASDECDELLAIRLHGHPHLLRLADVARLVRVRGLLRYPHPSPAWLGLAGLGGQALPVYDLAVLTGHPPAPSPSWVAVCAAAPAALAFEAFEGQFQHPRAAPGQPAPDVLQVAGAARPVVDVAAVLAAIQSLARAGAASKET